MSPTELKREAKSQDVTRTTQAHEPLRESEAHFRAMVDAIPQLAWSARPDGWIEWYNRRWHEYTGTTPEQMEGWGWQSVHDPRTLPAVLERWKACIATGEPFDMTFPLRGADGIFRPFLTRVMPLKDEQGRVQRWFGTNTDVSEQKQAEEARARLAAVVESSEDAILSKDLDGVIRSWNAGAQRLFGYWPEEILGRPITVLVPPERQEEESRIMARLRAGERLEHFETVGLTKDGHRLDVSVTASPVRDGAGEIIGVSKILRDITQRKRAEVALRQSEQRVRLKLESILSPEGDVGRLELADVIDAPAIQTLMDEFHKLVAIPMAIIDLKGQVLVGVGWQEICTRFHRVHPQSCQHCLESDTQLSAGIAPGEFKLYKCKNHMWDMATPILVGGKHLGNLFLGQFFFEDETPDRDLFRSQAKHYGFEEAKYLAALDRVPRLSRQTLKTAMAYFSKLADLLSKLSHSNVKLARSLTERERREEELRRLNRTQTALKNSSLAMMRANSEADYLNEVCTIVVEDCGHAMVWIGYAQEDEARSVRPVAHAGFEEGYLETLGISWADTDRGRGPTGTAIRTGKAAACPNMLADPRFAPWRADARQRGYASSIALPLLVNDRAFGALTIYSRHQDPFTENEQKLLSDLAKDLAYGIQALRLRSAKAEAEKQLRLLSTAVEAAVNGIVISDRDGVIRWVNPAFSRLTGYRPEEVVGQNPRLLKSGQHSPEFYRQMWATILKGEPWQGEVINRHKNGSLYTEEMAITPVRGSDGKITHFVAIKHDITTRKRAEQRTNLLAETASALLKAHSPQRVINELCERVMAFLDCQAFFNFLVDERAGCLRLNACAGIPAEELGKVERLEFGAAICGCAVQDGCRIVAEDIRTTPDPRTDLVKTFGIQAYACHPLRVQGRVLGTLSFGAGNRTRFTEEELALMNVVADLVAIAIERQQTQAVLQQTNEELKQQVAERQRAQESLQRAAEDLQRSNRDLEQFAYVASHDLQEPLRAVGGYVKLLQRRFPENLDPKAIEYITGAAEGAARMERLITDLLAFSRVGTKGAAFAPADLEAVLDDALRNLQTAVRTSETKITREPLPVLPVDATQIMQLLQNLIGNAIKFRGEHPPAIHIGAQKQDGCWRFSVRDNGIGIEPQYFERIFQIFQRLHTRKHYPGTGIGLAICKKIVERHGGTIGLESTPGQGSVFYFTLPELSADSETPYV